MKVCQLPHTALDQTGKDLHSKGNKSVDDLKPILIHGRSCPERIRPGPDFAGSGGNRCSRVLMLIILCIIGPKLDGSWPIDADREEDGITQRHSEGK